MNRKGMTVLLSLQIIILSMFSMKGSIEAEGKDGFFGGGSGTVNDPLIIEDVWDLQNISTNLTAHYVLANDIDASETRTWNSGAGFVPIGTNNDVFLGSLDGRNHTVIGMFINRSSTHQIGLFGSVGKGGSVKNIGLSGIEMYGGSFTGGLIGSNCGSVMNCNTSGCVEGFSNEVGGLIGFNSRGIVSYCHSECRIKGQGRVGGFIGWNTGILTNCFASGNVLNGDSVGGFIGRNEGTVSDSYSTGSVNAIFEVGGFIGLNVVGEVSNSYSLGNVTGDTNVGGFVGFTFELGCILNCYAHGSVSGNDYCGGLVGRHWCNVSNSYSTGKVKGNKNVGGLLGSNSGSEYKCFWDEVSSGVKKSAGGTGMMTVGMKTRATFTEAGWDFHDTWCILEHITYPMLRWQDGGYPYADAGPDQFIEPGTQVIFNGGNSSDPIGIINYTWKFIDETYKSLYGEGPIYSFQSMGVFTVSLFVTNTVGNVDEDHMTVNVIDLTPPTADAGPDSKIAQGTIFRFDGTGCSDNVEIVHYNWTFFDDRSVLLNGPDPAHRFQTPGVFHVTLNISDASGNWDTDNMTVTVNDITPPNAEAGLDQMVDQGTNVAFDGGGSYDNVGIVNFTWTLFDGVQILLFDICPQYRFDHPGIYLINLNVSDAAGNWDSDNVTVIVNDIIPPVADAGPDLTVLEGTIVIFNGSGSSDNVGIISYTWSFEYEDEMIVLNGISPSFLFNISGPYRVLINVSDAAGNWDEDSMNLTVNEVTNADITPPSADAGENMTVPVGTVLALDGSLSSDNEVLENFTWSFTYGGIERSLFGAVVTHQFDIGGMYEITLTVIDGSGNYGVDRLTVTVIDTGRVYGMVHDDKGNIVAGASVVVLSSNGRTYSTTTGANGSFSLVVFHGNFNWSISKEGYRTISGSSSVKAMGEALLDLSDHPLVREDEKKDRSSLFLFVLLAVLILMVLGIAFYLLIRKKEGYIEE